MADNIDSRTGRPFGDHGTANDAIDFVLNGPGSNQPDDEKILFLEEWWGGGAYEDWPEFYTWLKEQGR